MINEIKDAANKVGITTLITNSDERIETQLNRITRIEDLPIMLVSWDIESTIEFGQNGFFNNPASQITLLLMTKSETKEKKEYEDTSEKMGQLFIKFARALNDSLVLSYRGQGFPLKNISYKLVPKHGLGKHSGVLGKFTMFSKIDNC